MRTSGHVPSSNPAAHADLPDAVIGITQEQEQLLLAVCRATLAVAVARAPSSLLDAALADAATMREPAAVFVTLTEEGELRGCVGSVVAERALPDAVVAASISAALRDPRFRPVTHDELPALHVEISVLGPPVPFAGPSRFRPGIDGLIVERGMRRALLLPEVAADWGWGAIEMLEAVCEKAGLDADAWQDGRTHVSCFRTARFGGDAVAPGAHRPAAAEGAGPQ